MSWFELGGRFAGLRRAVLVADAVWRLGPGWVLFRLRYELARRTGLLVRRSPVSDWPALEPCAGGVPPIVAVDVLKSWLRGHSSPGRVPELVDRVDGLRERRFAVFGAEGTMADWHHDAIRGVHYDPLAHWSRVPVPPGADVKFVWDPSRFGWAFDVARAHLLVPESGAADLFWELFDEWTAQNPPNTGVNWSCGQEASIRLMAAVCAASALRDATDEGHATALQRLAWVTAARVETNIGYARSQRNNHHASEAVGLLTASLLFPGHRDGPRWRRLGEEHLREVCDTLVFDDGGTSQYSTNYHRVFVHNMVWATELYRTVGEVPPGWLTAALARSAAFLAALVEPGTGSGPFFGNDDGAKLLPLASVPHRDLAQDVALAMAAHVGSATRDVPASEGCAWFGLADAPGAQGPADPAGGGETWVRSFPEMGIHVLAAGSQRACVRAGTFRFRPSHDDLLHCDIWLDGINVAPDSGTASYHPTGPDAAGMLDSGDHHNGPRHPGRPLMEHASRFLWASWPSARVVSLAADEAAARGSFEVESSGDVVRRDVELTGDSVVVTDSSATGEPLITSWRLPAADVARSARWSLRADAPHRSGVLRSWSDGYGTSATSTVLVTQTDDGRETPLCFSAERVPSDACRDRPPRSRDGC